MYAVMWRSPLISPFPTGLDLFSLFQISLENYLEIKFKLWKDYNLDPNIIESLPYYEYELLIDNINNSIEKENAEIKAKAGYKEIFSFDKTKRIDI